MELTQETNNGEIVINKKYDINNQQTNLNVVPMTFGNSNDLFDTEHSDYTLYNNLNGNVHDDRNSYIITLYESSST